MAYQRKTVDVFDVMTNYGYGWEAEVTEVSLKDAVQTKKEYIENARGLIGIYIRKRRERKAEANA